MKKEELDQLKSYLEGNSNFIGLGYKFAKNMIINDVIEEKRRDMQHRYNFSSYKDAIINGILKHELEKSPLEEGKGEESEPENEVKIKYPEAERGCCEETGKDGE